MRKNSPNRTAVLDELSRTLSGDDRDGSYDPSIGSTAETPHDVELEFDELMEQINDVLPTSDVQFDDSLVKENLDEILLLLISIHGETHGKELLSDLSHLFGTELSPGTVYPSLHAFEEAGVLSMHAKVRTKEYSISDDDFVRSAVEGTMVQHLAFGLLLYEFLQRS